MNSGRRAFTLIEIMLAVGILGLVLTAVTIGVRGKWKTEQARRGAQQVVVAWTKARSNAWREGREWVVVWNPKESQLRATPMDSMETEQGEGTTPTGEKPALQPFDRKLDSKVQLLPEPPDEELPTFHFLPNGRVRHANLLVRGPENDTWRVRTDWSGIPMMEFVSGVSDKNDKAKNQKLPTIDREKNP